MYGYTQALERLEAAYGERHWLYVSAMHNLALNYQAAGKGRPVHTAVLRLRAGGAIVIYCVNMYGN